MGNTYTLWRYNAGTVTELCGSETYNEILGHAVHHANGGKVGDTYGDGWLRLMQPINAVACTALRRHGAIQAWKLTNEHDGEPAGALFIAQNGGNSHE